MVEIIGASGTLLTSATLAATARVRTNLSMTHLFSAARFSRAVGHLETSHAAAAFGEFFEEIFAYASACVVLAVSGLEAFSNELYVDSDVYLPAVSPDVIARVWNHVERSDVFSKIDLALVLQGRPTLDRGLGPVQDVGALAELRNALMHFKPEWEDEASKHRRVSNVLMPKIRPTPFLPDPELLFPRRWASHDCTTWAIRSTVAMIRDIEVRLIGTSRMDAFHDRLEA
jgi:hypothetical protein